MPIIKVEVSTMKVEERSGTGKSGKPYHMRMQEAFLHVLDKDGKPQKYPVRFELPLNTDQPPYAQGDYTLDAASFSVGDFGRVEVRPVLFALSGKAGA